MSDAPQLQTVLDRIDADFDNSLERLFALLTDLPSLLGNLPRTGDT